MPTMNKKINRRRNINDVTEHDDEPHESVALLHNIHHKLDNSPALNGGFDRLLYKIDGIEKSQVQISEKVDKIHDAIYNPDDGLFARIAANKASQVESAVRIEKQVDDLIDWRDQAESVGVNCEKEADELQLKLQKLESSVEGIEKFQSLTAAAMKWSLAAIGGGLITLIFKVLYQAIKILP